VATVADLTNRQKRAVLRPVELGRERLEARVRRMPRLDALFQPHAQRLDELSERLKRGLMDRAGQGREKLTGVSARLSPSLLKRTAADAQRQLDRARLTPDLVRRPLAQKQEALTALARLAQQFHPEEPLKRGYAIVRDAQDKALTSRELAAKETALVLQFADGRLDVIQGDGAAPPPPKPKKPRRSPPASPKQDDLFG
jgi:exodeoxyribonuclease VII large subunit